MGVKGGVAGERSERTLDAREHLTTLAQGPERRRNVVLGGNSWRRLQNCLARAKSPERMGIVAHS